MAIHGRACPHMYKILRRSPSIRDVKIRWHVGYAHHYGKNVELNKHYIYLRDTFDLPGIPLVESEVTAIRLRHKVGEGEKPLKFFLNSFNKLRMRGECNYWQSIADRFPENVRACFGLDDKEIDKSLHLKGDDDDPTIEKDIHNKTPTMSSLPMGATQQVFQGTDYMVPSQMSHDESKQYDSPDDNNDNSIDNGTSVPYKTSSVPPQGVDAYKDFKHVIESICKLIDAAGM